MTLWPEMAEMAVTERMVPEAVTVAMAAGAARAVMPVTVQTVVKAAMPVMAVQVVPVAMAVWLEPEVPVVMQVPVAQPEPVALRARAVLVDIMVWVVLAVTAAKVDQA